MRTLILSFVLFFFVNEIVCGRRIIETIERPNPALKGKELNQAVQRVKDAFVELNKKEGLKFRLFRTLGGHHQIKPKDHQNLRIEIVDSRRKYFICNAEVYADSVEVKCGNKIHLVSSPSVSMIKIRN